MKKTMDEICTDCAFFRLCHAGIGLDFCEGKDYYNGLKLTKQLELEDNEDESI